VNVPPQAIVTYEPNGLRGGRPCVVLHFTASKVTIRMSLPDAETIGEALIAWVRRAEEHEAK
jgi:hypothetical protein